DTSTQVPPTVFDTTPPTVTSVTKNGTSPTNASSVAWTVKFSEPVAGVENGDFSLHTTGLIASASVSNTTGSGDTYTVTANTGSGNGTIRLDVSDNDSITDAAGNKLGGT